MSWRPRAFVFHNFLTEAEADHIVAQAKPFVSCRALVSEVHSVYIGMHAAGCAAVATWTAGSSLIRCACIPCLPQQQLKAPCSLP